MSGQSIEGLRKRKLVEVEDLHKQAFAAAGVGRSLRGLAPVVRNELQSIVGMKLSQGLLAEEWKRAQEAAEKSDVEDSEKLLAAVSMMLVKFCDEAGKRVMEHGDILVAKHSELVGKANGIAEMIDELAPVAEDDEADSSTAKDEPRA